MSVGTDLRAELNRLVLADASMPDVLVTLRAHRDQGVTRAEVQKCLEALRLETDDEAVEDRILEMLDYVTGFCRAEDRVWPEPSR
jgi:hypothetical protein